MSVEHADTIQITFMPSGKQGHVPRATTVLDAARQLGIEIESLCGGRQTCGKCRVNCADIAPSMSLSAPGSSEQTLAKRYSFDLSKQRLACAAQVMAATVLHIPDESLAHKQIIRKEASHLQIDVSPAMSLYYVEVEPAQLGGPADLQRVFKALAQQWDVHHVTVDPLVLRTLQKKLRAGHWSVTLTIWQNQEIIGIEPGYDDRLLGLAVDVGTTTLAAHLCDLRTGKVLATSTSANPQIRYGEDIMSRISYCIEESNGLSRLQRAILKALNELAAQAAAAAKIHASAITDCVLVGNTVMLDLVLGIDPVELGGAPFALATQNALDIKARDLGLKALHPGAMVHLLPSVASHVGADNTAVLLSEVPELGQDNTLIVDIGTNAEILLACGDRILSASSPTGPAFEGAQITQGQRAAPGAIERVRITEQGVRYKVVGDGRWSDELACDESLNPTGICGSGIIEVVAELFLRGIIDKRGLLMADHPHPDLITDEQEPHFVLVAADSDTAQRPIIITQKDIRAIQLAKAALYAGIRLLMNEAGISHLDTIKLAGAFGSYIDPQYALILGLVPDCSLERVVSIGNAAGDGARIALLNAGQRAIIQDIVRTVTYIETAVAPDFQDLFVAAMTFPHMTDGFPHLQHLLPVDRSVQEVPHRVRRTRNH